MRKYIGTTAHAMEQERVVHATFLQNAADVVGLAYGTRCIQHSPYDELRKARTAKHIRTHSMCETHAECACTILGLLVFQSGRQATPYLVPRLRAVRHTERYTVYAPPQLCGRSI